MVVDGTLVNVLGVHGGGRYIGKCVRCAWWWTVQW